MEAGTAFPHQGRSIPEHPNSTSDTTLSSSSLAPPNRRLESFPPAERDQLFVWRARDSVPPCAATAERRLMKGMRVHDSNCLSGGVIASPSTPSPPLVDGFERNPP